MPAERSLYRKIQEVLDVAKSRPDDSSESLSEMVLRRNLHNFRTPQYDAKRDEVKMKPSLKSIKKAIGVCISLHLVEPGGQLSDLGRKALQPESFDGVIAAQTRAFIKENGISVSQLNARILDGLTKVPPVLATSKIIWEESASPLKLNVFSSMLALLANCGKATCSQKRIYLSFDLH